ncbi:HD domain-containing protein [Vallitaleaceae bacterium 9-2]
MNTQIDAIINHPKYKAYYLKIQNHEVARSTCKHDMSHFLDVARIAYILNFEKQLGISKKLIYATALLHDIGRFEQYERGIEHEISSASLCLEILIDTGFLEEEILQIQKAILNHRNLDIKDEPTLSGIIYRADKASRPCHSCLVQDICNWPIEKKNLTITY